MQRFIRSCTYYPAMTSIIHHPAMIYSATHLPAMFHSVMLLMHHPAMLHFAMHYPAKLLSCHAPPFSCATLPRSWLNPPPLCPYSPWAVFWAHTTTSQGFFRVLTPTPPPPSQAVKVMVLVFLPIGLKWRHPPPPPPPLPH